MGSSTGGQHCERAEIGRTLLHSEDVMLRPIHTTYLDPGLEMSLTAPAWGLHAWVLMSNVKIMAAPSFLIED